MPASAGLFADVSQAATEHLAGVEIFKQKDYVYRLSTMKRFTDATLVSLLTKMRRSGGCKLTAQEWKALRDTDISAASATEQRRRLQGTELWYQAAPTWATVAMAQVIRSRLSAVKAAATLFVVPAKDYLGKLTHTWAPDPPAPEIPKFGAESPWEPPLDLGRIGRGIKSP